MAQLEGTDNVVDTFHPDNPDAPAKVKVEAITFLPQRTQEDMAEVQSSDSDIGPLYRATANHQGRPDYQEVRGGSLALKAYWAELKRLEMHDNLLYRRWEDDTGDITRLQLCDKCQRRKRPGMTAKAPIRFINRDIATSEYKWTSADQ